MSTGPISMSTESFTETHDKESTPEDTDFVHCKDVYDMYSTRFNGDNLFSEAVIGRFLNSIFKKIRKGKFGSLKKEKKIIILIFLTRGRLIFFIRLFKIALILLD